MTNREKLWHKCWANENEEEEGLIVTPMGSLSAHISKSVPPHFGKDIISYRPFQETSDYTQWRKVTQMGSLSEHISKSVPPRFAKDIVSYNCHSTGHLKTHSEEKSHEWDLSQDILTNQSRRILPRTLLGQLYAILGWMKRSIQNMQY